MPTEAFEGGLVVIIPAHNAAGFLPRTLPALAANLGPEVPVIVVDDGSDDETAGIAEKFGCRVFQNPTSLGAAAARNLGVEGSLSELILFVDSDCVLQAGAGDLIREAFRDPELDALVGSYDTKPADPGFVSQFRNLLHSFVQSSEDGAGGSFWCGCGVVRRSALEAAGGFDSSPKWASIEDIELGWRLARAGRRIWFDSRLRVCHLKKWSLWNMVRTDVFYRAMPWTRLILQSGRLPNQLNLRWQQRWSVALVGASLLLTAASMIYPRLLWAVLPTLLGVFVLNREFYRFLKRCRGIGFAMAAFPLHGLFFCCAGIGFVLGIAAHWLERRHPQGRSNAWVTSAKGNGSIDKGDQFT